MTHKLSPRSLLTGVLAITFAGSLGLAELQAQPEPMRWGSIPDEHVGMTVYAPDTSASGVVLGSYSQVYILDDLSMVQEVHRRVKLFNEAAYDMATVELYYLHGGGRQRLRQLEGQTFVADPGGGLRRVELRRSDVHEERDGELMRVRFTLPALEPGAIIEYRYRIRTNRLSTMPSWLFQDRAPTLWSEYRAQFPAFITINRHPSGQPRFFIEEIDEQPFSPPQRRHIHGRAPDIQTTSFRWVMRDVPALRDEDFVASIWNHALGMRFQISGYYDNNLAYRPLSQSWEDVAERLRSHEDFGRRLRATRGLRAQVDELTAGAADDTEKLHRIYDFIRSGIVWDQRYRLFATRPLDRVIETRSGSSGEINLLLIAMLRAAGIEANPILISTRRNGRVIGWFASARQFNHVFALALADGQEYRLDATDPLRPVDMLPVDALNGDGWLLGDDRLGWLPIQPARSSVTYQIDAAITPEGDVRATFGAQYEGYAALKLRHRLTDAANEEERQAALAGENPLRYADLVIDGLEDGGEIQAEGVFTHDEHARQMAHLLTFNPILLSGLTTSPFTAPTRTYPVDFRYPMLGSYVATFTLPEGYEVEELPQPVRLSMPRQGIRYVRIVTLTGGMLRVHRTLDVNQTYFDPREYDDLRSLYDRIVAADAAVVVLTNASAAAEVE